MENEEAKRLAILSTISRYAGAGVGTVVAAGGKVTGTVKNLLTRPVDDFAVFTGEQDETTPQTPALEPEIENSAPREDELVSKVTALVSDLAEVRSQLAEAQNQVEYMQSQFASQLNELKLQKDSLIFDLEQTTKEVNHLKSTETTLRARITAMESELDVTKAELEKARRTERFARPQLLSEAGIVQTDPGVLLSEQQDETAVSAEEKAEPAQEVAAAENKDEAETAIEDLPSQSQVAGFDIPMREDADDTETEQSDLPEQKQQKPVMAQIEQEIGCSMETTTVQSSEQERAETKVKEFGPVIAENSSSVPADVTIEQVNAADFDSAAEKIIFIKALSDIAGQDKAMRADAVKVIAGIRHELSVRALVAQMAKEPAIQVRAECIKALATLNMKEGLPAVVNALSEQDVSVRLAAVRSLYRLGGVASAPELIRMLCDENENVRRRAATCIGWLGKQELAVELLPLLDDSSVPVRLAAVEAMGNLHSREVVSALIEHLGDPEKTIRRAVISALRTITGKKMSGPFPGDEKSLQILIIRWRQWWKDPASQIPLAATLER